MAKVGDYNPHDVVAYLDSIWNRCRLRTDGSLPAEYTFYPSTEECRMIFAALTYLGAYYLNEVGIEDLPNSLARCERFLDGKVKELKKQPADDRQVHIVGAEILIFRDTIKHLDRFAIMREAPPKKEWKKKK